MDGKECVEMSNSLERPPAEQSVEQSEPMQFGWGKFRPKCLKFLTDSKCFLVVIMLYTLCGAITMNGLPVLVLPTIEKRFSLSSKELGIVAVANDFAALLFVVFISFYGDYGNKIKWVGGGAAVTGFGVLFFSLPHLLVGQYAVPEFEAGTSRLCLPPTNSSSTGACDREDSGTAWYYIVIFVIAQFIHGAGICPLYSLVPAYLDENVELKQVPIYLGLWYLSAFVGPGIGILLGGQFLSVFVDVNQPSGLNLTPKDTRWIGAWWLGYIVFGVLYFVLAIAISGFPSSLPGAKERREKNIQAGNLKGKTQSKHASLKEILPELKSLFLNWTFIFNTLGISVTFTFLGALVPFLGKILQLKFDLDPVTNGYILSAIMTPTIVGGVILGALAVRQFPVKRGCKMSALYSAVSSFLTITAPLIILIPGCLDVNIIGVSIPHIDRMNSTQPQIIEKFSKDVLLSHCNINCSCSIDQFSPVCGSDNIVYANPCYAGCTAKYDNQTFGSCSCISTNTTGTASRGYCDRNCKNLNIFLAVIGVGLFFSFSASIPVQTVVLRCVPDDKRAFAMGVQYVFLKIIGLIPGPIILGHLLDLSCLLWQKICDEKGRCFVYDVDLVSRNVCIFGLAAIGMATVSYVLSWFLYKPEQPPDVSVNENKYANGISSF